MKKRTLKSEISFSGYGLHSGNMVNLTVSPAGENHGIKFQRTDIDGSPIVRADVSNVDNTVRSTVLKQGSVEIKTPEHILSALLGLGIDNVLISLDGSEVPILDGSAKEFTDGFLSVGFEEQEAEKEYFVVESPIVFDDGKGTEIMALPSDDFSITAMIDFNSAVLGKQYAEYREDQDYSAAIAPCKTFVFAHELIKLVEHDLIKGGTLDNAIVIANEEISDSDLEQLSTKINIPSGDFNRVGIVNNSDLLFENEPARHKILDIIGDLALLGKPIKGKIIAKRPGHSSNIELTKMMKTQLVKQKKLKGKPKYDPNAKPVLDIEQVKAMLPHRYPFLMIDKIILLSDDVVVGVKNVTGNENFFQGHFPGNPVFPGVLQMEALAQTGGILALSKVEDPYNWDTYFLKMDNVKFKAMVIPGDTIILKMELIGPIRRGIITMQATAYVGDTIVSEGELTAQIVKRNVDK